MSTGLWRSCNRTVNGVVQKQCITCKQWIARDLYRPKGGRKVQSECRECEAARARAWARNRSATLWQVWQ